MKKFFRFISFMLVLMLVFCGINICMSTNSDRDSIHIRGYFKEPENSIDVLLIGASELYTGFNSPMAWKEYGYTSYAISYAAAQPSLYKTMLETALKTQTPQLTVFDVTGFLRSGNNKTQMKPAHAWFDNVGMDKDNIEGMQYAVDKEFYKELRFPFYKFHNNWRHPSIVLKNTACRFFLKKEGISYTKALAVQNKVRKNSSLKNYEYCFSPKSKKYLTDLLECCKNNGLKQVLFIISPHCVNNRNTQVCKEMDSIIDSYGYSFADFENAYSSIGLDTKNDFYNNDHMNVWGMEKYTRFISEYFLEKYEINREHSEEVIREWDRCAEITENLIDECKSDEGGNVYYELTAYENVCNLSHKISRAGTVKREEKSVAS